MFKKIVSSQLFWVGLGLFLLFPSLLFNLGLNPFIEDEAIRGTVALEMMYSGNYITPTINGVYYYYKPPLYNWILVLFYNLFGVSDWSSRIATVFFLFCFGTSIYLIHRKVGFRFRFSILVALLYVTCGRLLFWDSFLGLIDVFYSWMMYLLMVYIFLDWKEENYWKLYIRAFLFLTIGFMLKGYPSFLFLGLTLITVAWIEGKWKKLFHPGHIIGWLIFSSMVGGYYLLYNQYHDVTNTVMPLLSQATLRTGIWFSIFRVIQHVLVYPFENIYHFLPWSLMVILAIRKDILTKVRSHPFIWFSLLAFLANILVYWLSPQVYPRYILMLIPLIFTVFLYLYEHTSRDDWRVKTLHVLWGFIVVGAPILLLVGVMNRDMTLIDHLNLKVGIFLVLLSAVAMAYVKIVNQRILILVAAVLIVRMIFNTLVIPIRTSENIASDTTSQAIEVARKYGPEGISMYEKSIIDFTSTFYAEKELGYILDRTSDTPYKIIDQELYEVPAEYEVIDTFMIRRDERILKVMRKMED